jgi:hypothetical protein
MQYFYDGQLRKYITQIVRAFSNFSYKDGSGETKVVPAMYGDITKQVSSIIRDNSENKIPSAPRISVYVTGLDIDRTRTSDSSFVSKMNIRERAYDNESGQYLNQQAKGYTVERLHPVPYTLSVNIDIWSTNTDQKLQILEQILMLYNPDLEIQTNDNYIDWTSLSLIRLENVNFSSRSIPVGAGDEIDVATLGLVAPIYISPPVKVKKLGVITNIITSIFNPEAGTIQLDGFNPPTDAVISTADGVTVLPDGTLVNENAVQLTKTIVSGNGRLDLENPLTISYRSFDLIVSNATAKVAKNRQLRVGEINWLNVLEAELPAKYEPNISQIRLYKAELLNPIVGTFEIRANDTFIMDIDWDVDTLPADTLIQGPVLNTGSINKIVNPLTFNPTGLLSAGTRYLFTNPVGYGLEDSFTVVAASNRIDTDLDFTLQSSIPGRTGDNTVTSFEVFVDGVEVSASSSNINGKFVIFLDSTPDVDSEVKYIIQLNEDGADAWKNADGTDILVGQNDIIEWDGSQWHTIFDSSVEGNNGTYITNLSNNQQIYWNGYYWQASIDGYYPRGTWEIIL